MDNGQVNSTHPSAKIPVWVNIMQVVLILIMLQQVYLFALDHAALGASGIGIDGAVPTFNLLYEFAARTATMALVSLFVVASQNPRYYLPILFMNVVREGFETIIDPMFPLANAPASPAVDLATHLVIVAVEIAALVTVVRIVRRMDAVDQHAVDRT